MHTHTILVIGYGNPLRCDDGLGWHVANLLEDCLKQREMQHHIHILRDHQLQPEMAEPISQAIHVLFVDASIGDTPGTIACSSVHPDDSVPDMGIFSHQLTPAGVLAWALAFYGRCPAATVVSVVGASFAYSESLSPTVDAVLPDVVNRIVHIIAAITPNTDE